jgi:uncharacterized protein with NRDE domain
MCLIGFAWLAHPRWRLVLAGNRDEFHDRPAAAAGWWADAPGVFGGRDLQAGGSWLAIDRRGRLAVVTNYRDPGGPVGPRSRGELVADFVRSDADIDDWSARIADKATQWSGFNLLLFDLAAAEPRARYVSNRRAGPEALTPGVHGLSNHLLNTDWPKVRRLRERVSDALAIMPVEPHLFEALADDRPPPDAELPDTGVGLQRERLLASARIRGDGYGTRASTLVLVGHDGRVEVAERSWSPAGDAILRESRASFGLAAAG